MSIGKLLSLLVLLVSTSVQAAEPWPSRPVRFVVPYAAGGAADITSRLLAQSLTASLGQTVVVDNRTGAGGNIGTDIVAKAPADGYTMLFAYAGTMGINPFLYKNLPFNPVRDFAPVTLIAEAPLVLAVHPSIPARNINELVAHAKANPDKLSFGSAGTGAADHLAGELFKTRTGTTIVHVPYKGGAPALIDLVAGRTQIQFVTIPGALAHIRAGRIRPLAILSAKRFDLLPDVPTIAEAGLSDFEINNWYGVALPAGTPAPIIKRLNGDLIQALQSPQLRARFLELGLVPQWNSPEEFITYIRNDSAKWEKIVRASGATAE